MSAVTDWIFLKLEIAQIKTTINGRGPQNIKSEISQQQLSGYIQIF